MSSPEDYDYDYDDPDFDAQSGDPCGCKICVARRKREEELKAIIDGDDPPESEKDALFIELPDDNEKPSKSNKGCGDLYLTLANEYHPNDILPRGSSLPHANHPKNCNCDLCLGE